MSDFILSEKSKAEFVEYIAQDGIECWFEGDRFVMPSGQGRTAKGIVIHKLQVWKLKEAAIQEMDEVIKLQDADLRKYEKQIEGLKEQLNNMEACYIEKKKERDELHAVLKCVSEHFEMNDLDSCMPRVFEMIQEALRGAND